MNRGRWVASSHPSIKLKSPEFRVKKVPSVRAWHRACKTLQPSPLPNRLLASLYCTGMESTPVGTEFRPSILRRWVLLPALFVVVFLLLNILINGGGPPLDGRFPLLPGLLGGLIGFTLGLAITDAKLLFQSDKVRGRSRSGLGWVEFPLQRLDRRRSCYRSLHQRLLGYQVLYSVNGDKIRWDRLLFSKEAVAQVLNRLGCE